MCMDEEDIRLPRDFRFDCLLCGDCCKGWDIPVGDEAKKRIEGLDWRMLAPDFSFKKFFLKASGNYDFNWVMCKKDDSCVFLESNKCLIHKIFGYDVKDLTCRQYPATFTKTPDGVYVGFSFACASIRENLGNPAGEFAGEYRRLWSEMSGTKADAKEIMLSQTLGLSWSAYKILEDAFTEIICEPAYSLAENIFACNNILEELASKNSKGKLGDAQVNDAVKLFESRKPLGEHPDFAKRQRIVIGFSVIPHAIKEGKIKDALNSVSYYKRFVNGGGEVKLANVGKIHLKELGEVVFTPEEEDIREYLERYFTHFLFRKSLLVPPSVLDNLKLMATGYALIRFYSSALALSRGVKETGLKEVVEALGCVDRYFLLHSTLSKTLLSDKKTEFLLRKFIDQKDYVECMLYDKSFTQPA